MQIIITISDLGNGMTNAEVKCVDMHGVSMEYDAGELVATLDNIADMLAAGLSRPRLKRIK
jgi:hypothetical protein